MLVLVADDNPEMRRVIRQYLESLHPGLQIIECSEGGDAVVLYATHRPGLVLMDIRMEPTDGLTATASITREDPEAQVCIVTNFDDQDLRDAARAAGARGYVTKDRLSDLRTFFQG
jgi:DNA-binding NarL/FixJ family response regulator